MKKFNKQYKILAAIKGTHNTALWVQKLEGYRAQNNGLPQVIF